MSPIRVKYPHLIPVALTIRLKCFIHLFPFLKSDSEFDSPPEKMRQVFHHFLTKIPLITKILSKHIFRCRIAVDPLRKRALPGFERPFAAQNPMYIPTSLNSSLFLKIQHKYLSVFILYCTC